MKKNTNNVQISVYWTYFFSLCLCFSSMMNSVCHAQEKDSLLKTQILKEITVKGILLRKQNTTASPTQILTQTDLNKIPSISVADALRYFSGVQLKDYGGIGGLKTVNIRSMGSQYTGVFYNGIQIDNAQNSQVDLGKFSLENLEEIALINGQSNAILLPAKAYASGSSIFLKTKTPHFQGLEKNHMEAFFKTGSFGLFNPSFNFQHKLNENISSNISVAYTTANGKYPFNYTNGVYDTTAIRQNGDVTRWRTEASVFGTLKNNAHWNAQVYAFTSNRGLPGAIVANKFNYSQRIWDENYFVQGNYEQHFEKFALALHTKFSTDYTRYLDPEYITSSGFLDNKYHEKAAYISASGNYQMCPNFSIGFASDYQIQHLTANLYRFAFPTRNSFLNVLSAKYNKKRLSIEGALLSNIISDQVRWYASAGQKRTLNPSVMFNVQPFENSNWRLRGFYKDLFRMPTFNDLYYTFVGNTQLKPERSRQYNFGATYVKTFTHSKIKYIDFQTDAYYNQIQNKIIAQPGANLFRWTMYNLGKVSIKGLDVNAKTAYLLSNDLLMNFALHYTFQQALDVTSPNDENYKSQIPYIPKHSGSVLGNVDFKRWHLNYSFIYTGKRYNQKANIIYNEMEPWYTHDAAIGYSSYLNKKYKINVDVEVNNFLNQYYDVIPNFPLPGRNYRLSLKFEL